MSISKRFENLVEYLVQWYTYNFFLPVLHKSPLKIRKRGLVLRVLLVLFYFRYQ